MGQVYLARSTGLGGFERQVVVKTLDLGITDDDSDAFVTMFLDEARLVGKLHHQYISPVYEVGCDEEGRYYLVMDYVNGETTEAVFQEAGDKDVQLPLAFALSVVSCVASALDYAHNLCAADGTPLDIVHRDVSLSNVMVGYDGGIKLIDFGIAKAANRATKTQVGTMKGKIGYLAPEQVLRKHVDHRADIFALGIVLYELTTQARAFREASDLNTLERITKGEFTLPSKATKGYYYPAELEAIIVKALEVDPDDRYQDVREMGRELEQLAAKLGMQLGHGPVTEVMSRLFAGKQGRRRRLARASNEISTDPNVTPLTPEPEEDTDVRRPSSPSARSLKQTVPLGPSSAGDEDRATVPVRARGTRDDMERIDASSEETPPPMDPPPPAPRRATPPPLPPPPRIPTGPQLPLQAVPVEEAPTEIAPMVPLREDPTDVSEQAIPVTPVKPPTATASFARPIWRADPTRTWLLLCGLFGLAIVTAVLVALL
jgi:serine/threonine-protein kinase